MSLKWSVVGDLFLALFGKEAPTAAEWRGYMDFLLAHRYTLRAAVIFTEGGGPTVSQRAEMHEKLPEFSANKAAIITDSSVVRGIVTAFRWLGAVNWVAFSPDRLQAALQYVGSRYTDGEIQRRIKLLQERP
jgi:hypothetical protein